MRAYRITVGSGSTFTMLAEDARALFDRLALLADANDPKLDSLQRYSASVHVEPLGEVV